MAAFDVPGGGDGADDVESVVLSGAGFGAVPGGAFVLDLDAGVTAGVDRPG
jgi:hypothetical protein